MIVNCWRRYLLVFDLPTPRQLCSNGSPRPSEVLDGLCHSLSVDLSNTAWALTGLINELSENAFGTVTRIPPWKSVTLPDAGFSLKNKWRCHKQDSSLKTHGQAMAVHVPTYEAHCSRLSNCPIIFGAMTSIASHLVQYPRLGPRQCKSIVSQKYFTNFK